MYSSNSQHYPYMPDNQQARRNGVPHASQTNHGQSQFVGSMHPNGAEMPHPNGSYVNTPMAPPIIQDTAESIQRDFDQYMRDTAGSRALYLSARHQSAQVIHQHPPTTVNPDGGQQAILPGTGGKEPSSSRSHSFASKPYDKAGAAARVLVKKDAHTFPVQLDAVMGPGTLAPTGYVVVPQRIFYCGPTTYSPIEFMPYGWLFKGNKSIHGMKATHRLERGHEVVLSHLREIMIKIQWPGYSRFEFETRIEIGREGKVIRGELVELVYDAVDEFVRKLRPQGHLVERGMEKWMTGWTGLKTNKFFISGLHHRGGIYFQPEIWVIPVEEHI